MFSPLIRFRVVGLQRHFPVVIRELHRRQSVQFLFLGKSFDFFTHSDFLDRTEKAISFLSQFRPPAPKKQSKIVLTQQESLQRYLRFVLHAEKVIQECESFQKSLKTILENNKETEDFLEEFRELEIQIESFSSLHFENLKIFYDLSLLKEAEWSIFQRAEKTQKTFILEGWIPRSEFYDLKRWSDHIFLGDVFWEHRPSNKFDKKPLSPLFSRMLKSLSPSFFPKRFFSPFRCHFQYISISS